MNQVFHQLAPDLFPIVFALIQIACIASIAWVVYRMLPRRSQQQHFVWVAALVAIALVVPLQSLMPSWQLAVLDDTSSPYPDSESLSGPVSASHFDRSSSPIMDKSEPNESSRFSDQAAGDLASAAPLTRPKPAKPIIDKRLRSVGAPTASNSAPITPSGPPRSSGTVGLLLRAIPIAYAVVTLVLLIRFIISCLRLHLIKFQELTSQRTLVLISVAERDIGIVNRPRIRLSRVVSTPMAYGIIRPTIFLPLDFESWPVGTQRTVMLHELCHVKRRDAIWDFLAGLLCIAYWFHPAVHFVRRHLQRSRETATDQAVLELGVAPALYAKDLLQVAIGKRHNRMAIPMAAETDLKERIERVLETDVAQTRRPHWPFRLIVLVGFVCLSACSFRLSAQAATQPATPVATSASKDQSREDSEQDEETPDKPNNKTQTKQPDIIPESDSFYELLRMTPAMERSKQLGADKKLVTASGRLLDEAGRPVANAIVVLRDGSSLSSMGGKINGLFAKTSTNGAGEFQFSEVGVRRSVRFFELLAATDSGQIAWKAIHGRGDVRNANIFNSIRLQLQPVTSLKGRLISKANQPITNAKLRISAIRKRNFGGGTSRSRYGDRTIAPSTTSDENGEFEFPTMPVGYAVTIVVEHPDYAGEYLHIKTSDEHPTEFAPLGDYEPVKILDNDLDYVVEKGILGGGRLVDAESKPIGDATITVLRRHMKTDAEGRFEGLFKEAFLNDRDETQIFVITHAELLFMKVSTKELAANNALIRIGNLATIKGIVLSSSSKDPIPGVKLTIRRENRIRTTTTNADGRFEFEIPSSGTALLKVLPSKGFNPIPSDGVTGGGFSMNLTEIKEDEIRELPPILLEPRKPRFATVVDSENHPVAEATIELLNQDGEFNFIPLALADSSKTDRDGQVMLVTDEPMGANSILIAKWESDGKVLIGEAMTSEDEENTKIVITEATVLRGKTTLNGQPLGGIELSISSFHQPKPGKGTFMRSVFHAFGRTRSDKDGNYSIFVPSTNYLDQVPTYSVSVSDGVPNPNASGIGRRISIENDEFHFDVDFKQGEGSISGRVIDANGQPVQDVSVGIQQVYRPSGKHSFQPYRLYLPSNVYTDAKGNFKLIGLPTDHVYRLTTYPGRRIINADREDYTSMNMIKPSSKPIEIRIPLKND